MIQPAFSGPRSTHYCVYLILIALSLSLVGCGSKPKPQPIPAPKIELPAPPPPTTLELSIDASQRLNLNTDGTAAPLLLRVYELADGGRFMTAGFFPLYEDERSALGADLVARDEIRVTPGESRFIEKRLDPATTTIGVMGAYRTTDERRWRATVPVLSEQANRLTVKLGANELNMQPSP